MYLNIGRERIEPTKEATFLSIILNNKLNFKSQIAKVEEKVIKANSILKYCKLN